jgi:prepilin-type N-terminal cleavage/methylation domain-containing protein
MSRAGFTLLEVLVAVVILATGIVLVLEAFHASLGALGEARDVLKAHRILEAKVAEAVRLGVEGSSALTGLQGGFQTPDGFQGQVQISLSRNGLTASGSSVSLYRVTVSVWRVERRAAAYTSASYVQTRDHG